jgi:DNA replication licensing factor MCM6
VSFYNFSRVERIRAMNTDKIGRLLSISGTVTRTTEVRPELMYGHFLCKSSDLLLDLIVTSAESIAAINDRRASFVGTLSTLPHMLPSLRATGKKCGAAHPAVEQQFQYTEPQICKNPQCKSVGDFQILMDKSVFVDWQRLRVQENADEIPPGSMPRCVDVICRNEVVETAKAGDKIIITGAWKPP